MLQEIKCSDVKVNSVIRLGRRLPTTDDQDTPTVAPRPRPIKMVLSTEEEKIEVLKSAKKPETVQGKRLAEDFHSPGLDVEGEGRTEIIVAGEEDPGAEGRNRSDNNWEEDREAVQEKRRTVGSGNGQQQLNSPMTLSKKLKSIYTNANSVIGKMDELRIKVQGGCFDVAAITESRANEDISDSELNIDGYCLLYTSPSPRDS